MTAIAVTVLLSAALVQSAQTFSPDAEGFIRNWLVLAPIGIQSESGATEIDRELIKGLRGRRMRRRTTSSTSLPRSARSAASTWRAMRSRT